MTDQAEKISGIEWRTLRIADYKRDGWHGNALVVDRVDRNGKRGTVMLLQCNQHVEGWQDVLHGNYHSYHRKYVQPYPHAA